VAGWDQGVVGWGLWTPRVVAASTSAVKVEGAEGDVGFNKSSSSDVIIGAFLKTQRHKYLCPDTVNICLFLGRKNLLRL
jgi:hypothetical protein